MIKLVYFVSPGFHVAERRFLRQANRSNFFDVIERFDERSTVLQELVSDNPSVFRADVKGFGFWRWKPVIMDDALSRLNESDTLVYADVGFYINSRGAARFRQYISKARSARGSILIFCQDLSLDHGARPEIEWTKPATLEFLKHWREPGFEREPQIVGGLLLVSPSAYSKGLISEWARLSREEPWLFDESFTADAKDRLNAHRHDQSVLSMLVDRRQAASMPLSEIEPMKRLPNGMPAWGTMRDKPFQARREKNNAAWRLARSIINWTLWLVSPFEHTREELRERIAKSRQTFQNH